MQIKSLSSLNKLANFNFLILIASIFITLAACGGNQENGDDSEDDFDEEGLDIVISPNNNKPDKKPNQNLNNSLNTGKNSKCTGKDDCGCDGSKVTKDSNCSKKQCKGKKCNLHNCKNKKYDCTTCIGKGCSYDKCTTTKSGCERFCIGTAECDCTGQKGTAVLKRAYGVCLAMQCKGNECSLDNCKHKKPECKICVGKECKLKDCKNKKTECKICAGANCVLNDCKDKQAECKICVGEKCNLKGCKNKLPECKICIGANCNVRKCKNTLQGCPSFCTGNPDCTCNGTYSHTDCKNKIQSLKKKLNKIGVGLSETKLDTITDKDESKIEIYLDELNRLKITNYSIANLILSNEVYKKTIPELADKNFNIKTNLLSLDKDDKVEVIGIASNALKFVDTYKKNGVWLSVKVIKKDGTIIPHKFIRSKYFKTRYKKFTFTQSSTVQENCKDPLKIGKEVKWRGQKAFVGPIPQNTPVEFDIKAYRELKKQSLNETSEHCIVVICKNIEVTNHEGTKITITENSRVWVKIKQIPSSILT